MEQGNSNLISQSKTIAKPVTIFPRTGLFWTPTLNKRLRACVKYSVALLCLITALHATPENKLPTLGDQLSGTVSPEQEYRIGRAWLRQLRSQVSAIDDPILFDYLYHLVFRLASNSDLEAPRLALIILNNPTINAFAVPGGVIGLNAGLLLHARSEDEVAAVVAHELAHLSQRHFARGTEQQKRNSWVDIATFIASIALVAAGNSDAGMAALATSQAASLDRRLRFSRENEREADRIGMKILTRSGFEAIAMPSFFQRLLEFRRFAGERPPEFLLTHPVSEARIADSRNRARHYESTSLLRNKKLTDEQLEFDLMRARITLGYARTPKQIIAELKAQLAAKKNSDDEVLRYRLAYAYLRDKNYESALQQMKPLLKQRPNRITYLYTKAEILIEQHAYSKAKAVLQSALALNPDNTALGALYGKAQFYLKNYQAAINTFTALQRQQPTHPMHWYMIAECQGKLGNSLGAHHARAEYNYAIGRQLKAIEQMKYAIALAGNTLSTKLKLQERLRIMEESQLRLTF